jgi:MinD-like ATPase involved in chromosome partitioning or flagellar assembly
MKIAIVNFSGNVGKTTLGAELFEPRMPGAKYFSVESLNIDASSLGIDAEKIKGKRFGELIEQLMFIDDAIVDVGTSNAEEFFKLMQQSAGSHEEFDFFIIPAIKEKKQLGDTINTIRALRAIGVSKSKIRVIFNKVDLDDDVEKEFEGIFALAEVEKSFVLNRKAVIYANEVFERLKVMRLTLGSLQKDERNYREEMRTEQDPAKRAHYAKLVGIQRLAVTANKNLDDVFRELTK